MPLTLTDIIFRYSTMDHSGKDGAGELTAAEGDSNSFNLAEAIIALQTSMGAIGLGITSIDQTSPTQFTITMSDASTQTLDMPSAQWRNMGEWQPNTTYAANDVVWVSDLVSLFVVLFGHLSAATFDANATDGNANDLYGLIFDLSIAGASIRQSVWTIEAGTTHTISSADLGVMWNCSNASGCTVTVPTDSTYDAPVNSEVSFRQGGAGAIVFAGAVGVTVDFGVFGGQTQYEGAVVTLKKVDINFWVGWGLVLPP